MEDREMWVNPLDSNINPVSGWRVNPTRTWYAYANHLDGSKEKVENYLNKKRNV